MKTPVLAFVVAWVVVCGVAVGAARAAKLPNPDANLASGRNCGSVVPTPDEISGVTKAIEIYQRANPLAQLAVGGEIKVAFHVIYNGNTGNIPQSQIDAQIAELNKAY